MVATGTEITRTDRRGRLGDDALRPGPGARVHHAAQPALPDDRSRDAGHPRPLILLPEDAEPARTALYDAVAALQVYSDRFGPYPYRDMAIVEAPMTFHGMEFPGLSLIGSQVYNQFARTWRRSWCTRWRTSGGTTRSAATRS